MITIQMVKGTNSQLNGFEVSGHAGAGPHGHDLVCAAVSMLSVTCTNALENVAKTKPSVIHRDGYLWVYVGPFKVNRASTVILKTFLQGAKNLSESYPENIKLINEGEIK